ncbi:hypothetical protein N7453_004257 [Penicillium expansum]|nr:hypothetical protein N7453_004257 [Penicillium expansum]
MSTTAANIFIGIWQNHKNETWPTWTLTLKQRDGGILSAALVLFVGFAATQAWNIVKLILHQVLLRFRRDGLDQQLQAMLRNSSTHAEAAWFSIRIPLGWRRQRGLIHGLARSSPILIVSLVLIASWAAAQILLSRIWTGAGDEFLVNSEICHWVNITDRHTSGQTIQNAFCQSLPRAAVNWTMSDVPCPFADPSLCISTNSTPVMLDTGYLSSSVHFGIHTRQEDSILYRRVANCSPVTTAYQDSPEKDVINNYYGPNGTPDPSNGKQVGLTFTYRDRVKTVEDFIFSTYNLVAFSRLWQYNATFTDRQDVKPVIMFITNPNAYTEPNYDPIFRTGASINTSQFGALYNASTALSILGCLEQYEICNPANPGDPICMVYKYSTDAGYNLSTVVKPLRLSEKQLATFIRLDAIHIGTDLASVASSSLFLASRTILNGIQWAELSSTQWRLELSRWFSEGLAMIQQGFVDSATVPDNNRLYFPQLSGTAASCKHQIVRNIAGLQNFNTLAIVIVLVLGSIIIVLGLTIDSIVGYVQRRFPGASEGWVHWTLDGVFQLQRLAYRGAGVRSWRDEDTYIPIVDGRALPGVDQQTMAFAECGSEEELRLMNNQEAKKTVEANRP